VSGDGPNPAAQRKLSAAINASYLRAEPRTAATKNLTLPSVGYRS
jgi:hypothetical protein